MGIARRRVVVLLAGLLTALACSGVVRESALARADSAPDGGSDGRKVAKSARLDLDVDSPEAVAPEAERIVTGAGGFVENSKVREEDVWLRCRVPASELDAVLAAVADLGDETYRSVGAEDVTERHADLTTRLRNARVLREKLQKLVARAKDVEDVLAIEKELARIQTEIEQLQGQLDRLDSRVELSSLSIHLERAPVLGPLGYVGYGLWWGFSKLFVIR